MSSLLTQELPTVKNKKGNETRDTECLLEQLYGCKCVRIVVFTKIIITMIVVSRSHTTIFTGRYRLQYKGP